MMANGLARIEQGIALLNDAKRAIERSAPVEELKQFHDQSEAFRKLAKKLGLQQEVANLAAESKLRTARAIGERLKEMRLHGGDRRSSSQSANLKIADLGIEKDDSSRWQKIASIPEPKFERYLLQTTEERREITTADALRLANKINHAKKRAAASSPCSVESSSDLPKIIETGTKFSCVYADPPWQYDNQGTRASTNNHYDTMTVAEIAAMPVADLVADEALLFLWTTNGFLFDSKQVIDGWGFEFKSSIIWVKPQIGIGNYVRNSHEFLLIASRGGMCTTDAGNSQKSWIQADRLDHSRKPGEFRRIVTALSVGPRLEMFGRERYEGWTVFGNQISKQLKFPTGGGA